jgi:NitT/TauT family transport system substrate-binding protein/putative hydroxymethylpyrimidine transport system substrate-binding protein
MSRLVALLAAVIATGLAACGDDGAEPGASREATLVLDFQPNAVHAGIYTALAAGEYDERGVDLTVREPSASTDAPKLLAAGRAELAILDIHDLAIARERGADLVGVAALVRRPLAAVIAGDRAEVRTPVDLRGASVGVTGLPSDDAVLDAVLESAGVAPDEVERVTIGFDSIAALSSGRVAAATAFWNAEGVLLERLGVPTREFRVADYGAPPYPELVLATSPDTLDDDADLITAVLDATAAGHAGAVADPDAAIGNLTAAVPGIDPGEQRAQLSALLDGGAFGADLRLDERALDAWARWDAQHGIVDDPPAIDEAFATDLARAAPTP